MKTILVATDFSPLSQNATAYAGHIAKSFQSKIILFHTYSIPTTVTDIAFMMVSAEDMQKENEEIIKKEAEKLQGNFGVEVEWIVRIGIPSDEIKILAGEKNADLIIMAISGAGASNKFFGSTTLSTVQKTKKNIIVVPHHASFTGIRRITYTTDFSHPSVMESFSLVKEMQGTFHADLHILHIQKPEKKTDNDELELKLKLDELLKGIPHDVTIIEADSILHGINEFIQKNHTQLLVMTMHRHNFMDRVFGKNFTKEAAWETKIPLLILHEKE